MNEENPKIENPSEDLEDTSNLNKYSKWVDNQGDEVKNVFGFNSSAELVNGRAAMIGFFMLILTEIVFKGEPVTSQFWYKLKMEEKNLVQLNRSLHLHLGNNLGNIRFLDRLSSLYK